MIRSAVFSPCGLYRYELRRHWGDPDSANIMAAILLNPSKASAEIDDPTSRRMVGFGRREGTDGLVMANAYALCATDPAELKRSSDPVGPETDARLWRLAEEFPVIVLAWGANIDQRRADHVVQILRDAGTMPMCFGTTKAGHPRHPLYLPADAPLVEYRHELKHD